MKNLILTNHKLFRLPIQPGTSTSSTTPTTFALDATNTSIALDHSKQLVYFVDDSLNLQVFHLITQSIVLSIPLISSDEDEDELLLEGDRVVNLHYLADSEALILISTSEDLGQIISISASGILSHLQPKTQESDKSFTLSAAAFGFLTSAPQNDAEENEAGSIEVIGQIPGGFSAASWSPDGELLVLGCNDGNVVVMTNQFDIISESPITGQITQQQQLAQANPYVHLPGTIQNKEYTDLSKANKLIQTSPEIDVSISWRGDSQYFITSSFQPFNHEDGEPVVKNECAGKRILRVWTRQCQLTSQSEPIPSELTNYTPFQLDLDDAAGTDIAFKYHQGLSRHLAWRPSGNIIATINTTRHIHGNIGAKPATPGQQVQQQYVTQQHVQFYERNGLERYSFPLHEPTLPSKHPGFIVCDMGWNYDSTILAISLYDLALKQLVVKCFMTKNYHWYCKYTYTIAISPQTLNSVKFLWQYNRHTRLLILSHNSTLHCLDLVEDNYTGPAPLYTSAVVDGRTLGLTHYARAAIPPPLSARSLLFPKDIINLHICNTVNPRTISYENSCVRSTAEQHYRLTTHCTNGMRSDIVAPMVVLTVDNELFFVTDAVEFQPETHLQHHNPSSTTSVTSRSTSTEQTPSQSQLSSKAQLYKNRVIFNAADNTIKPAVFAPESQPERQQGLNRATCTAKPIAYAHLSFQSVNDFLRTQSPQDDIEYDEFTYWRHVQWVHSNQWRGLLAQFDLTTQQTAKDAQCDSFIQHLTATTTTTTYNNDDINIVTVIQTTPNQQFDTLLILAFTFDFVLDKATSTWTPTVNLVTVNRHILNPEAFPQEGVSSASNQPSTTVAATSAADTNTVQLSTSAIELCPFTVSRVYTTPYSQPYPVPPEPSLIENKQTDPQANPSLSQALTAPTNEDQDDQPKYEPVDPQLDLEWFKKHELALASYPLLSLLTSQGHIIQIPININHNSTNKANDALLEVKYVPSRLVPDCLFFMVTSMHGEIVFVGLDQQQRLLINNVIVAPQCMSFALVNFSDSQAFPLPPTTTTPITGPLSSTGHGQLSTYVSNQQLQSVTQAMRNIPQGLFPSYLFVTVASQQHALFTVDLHRSIDDNINPMSALRQDSHFVRVVEKGSRIIACVPDIIRPRLIVQLPRGNIEVITPRSMGLASIFINLLTKQYQFAFRSLRTNKIDLNLLIDHNKSEFIANIQLILQELYLPDNITLLLSNLTNEDCTVMSMENNQYPRYHEMFISQITMKRLMGLHQLFKQHMNVLHLSDLDLQVASATNTTFNPHLLTTNQYDEQLLRLSLVPPSPIPGQVDYSDILATPLSPISHLPDPSIPASIIDTFIHKSISETNNAQLDFDFDLNAVPVNTQPGEDLDLLRKQLQLKKDEQKAERKKNLQGQQHQLKSTAQGFSNRTRAHQAMGNDTTNDNNKYTSDLGAEVGMLLTADGSGEAYVSQLSRVEHWGVGEMDIRHVYTSAERLFTLYQQHVVQSPSPPPLPSAQFISPDIKEALAAQEKAQQLVTGGSSQQPQKQFTKRPQFDKINTICDCILDCLNSTILTPSQTKSLIHQTQQYMLSILTAHLRKTPPNFVSAMEVLQNSAKHERSISNKVNTSASISIASTPRQNTLGPRPQPVETTSGDLILASPLPSISAERALKYMLILADKEELWKGALSTYDLSLAQSVAEHSGRDPKEYVPFLTTLTTIKSSGPILTTLQTTPSLVETCVNSVLTFVKSKWGHNHEIVQKLIQFNPDDPSTLYLPTNADLNQVNLPAQIGIALQRAYIDIYLKQYHQVILYYRDALNEVSHLLSQSPEQFALFVEKAYRGDFKAVYTMLIKIAFIVQSTYKLILEYIDSYPYLFHLAIHLYCSPLPPSIRPPQRTDPQSLIPTIPQSQLNLFTDYQYKLLSAYALWLVEHRQYRDAAHIFLHLGQINDAVACFTNCGDWRNVLIYIQRYPYLFAPGDSSIEINTRDCTSTVHHSQVQIYTKLAYVLNDAPLHQPLRTAQIQYYQLKQQELSIMTLFNAKEWKQAMLYATNYVTTSTDSSITFSSQFITPLQTFADKEIAEINSMMQTYRTTIDRLRLVRLVKQIIFGAQGNNKQCVQIYNKGAIDLGNVSGVIPRPSLVLRIPSDDILEFVITGCWRGLQTGLDVNGGGFNGSLGNLSTATGATLLSLAPSVAQSIQSISSAFSGRSGTSQFSSGRLSNGSIMSAGQGSMLSLGAAETALTVDERRLKKHMDKLKSKQGKKKVKGGDPREEEKLILDLQYFTPRTKRLNQWYELIDTCISCGLEHLSTTILSAVSEFKALVLTEENTPMFILDSFSEWQRTAIKDVFNWPAMIYSKPEDDIFAIYRARERATADDKLRQDLSHMSKSQKAEWDRSQAATLAKKLPLHVYGQRVAQTTTASVLTGDFNNPNALAKANPATAKQQAATHKGHQATSTLEQKANKHAQEQTWKQFTPELTLLCTSPIPTLTVLTGTANSTTIFEALLGQVLNDMKSTRRMTQLRIGSHNPHGQKSVSQKVQDVLIQ